MPEEGEQGRNKTQRLKCAVLKSKAFREATGSHRRLLGGGCTAGSLMLTLNTQFQFDYLLEPSDSSGSGFGCPCLVQGMLFSPQGCTSSSPRQLHGQGQYPARDDGDAGQRLRLKYTLKSVANV